MTLIIPAIIIVLVVSAMVMAISAGAKPAAVAVNNKVGNTPVVTEAEADEDISNEIEEILASMDTGE